MCQEALSSFIRSPVKASFVPYAVSITNKTIYFLRDFRIVLDMRQWTSGVTKNCLKGIMMS